MTLPPRPPTSQIPLFLDAKRLSKRIMRHLSQPSLLCWVMRYDDSIHCVRFNHNGSWRILT